MRPALGVGPTGYTSADSAREAFARLDAKTLLSKIVTDPQALYVEVGHLIASMPDLTVSGELPASTRHWLGRAYALVKETGELTETYSLDHHIKNLETPQWRRATVGRS